MGHVQKGRGALVSVSKWTTDQEYLLDKYISSQVLHHYERPFNMKPSIIFAILGSLLPFTTAQLSGSVGPLTSRATKSATKTCNVESYGGVADGTTDLGPPLASAFAACKTGGTGKVHHYMI